MAILAKGLDMRIRQREESDGLRAEEPGEWWCQMLRREDQGGLPRTTLAVF